MTSFHFIVLFICASLFGGVMGAYFGTVDHRVRHDEPLITTGCYCPSCRHKLPVHHQIPILSWIFLKGRCRFCHEPIPVRYPLIEGGFLLFYGVSFLLLWRRPLVLAAGWYLFFTALLLLRCQGHYRSAFKGWCIFAGYHLLFTALLGIILAALSE